MTALATDTLALAARLRTATAAEHDEAENMGFITKLMGGELPISALADFHAQHHVIYKALEDAGDCLAGDAIAKPFVFEELRRLPSLKADLEFLLGPDWQDQTAIYDATLSYDSPFTVAVTWSV